MKLIDKLQAISVDPKKIEASEWPRILDLISEIEALSPNEVAEVMACYGKPLELRECEDSIYARINLKLKGFVVETVSEKNGFQNLCTQKGYLAVRVWQQELDGRTASSQLRAKKAHFDRANMSVFCKLVGGQLLMVPSNLIPGFPQNYYALGDARIVDDGKAIYWDFRGYGLTVDCLVSLMPDSDETRKAIKAKYEAERKRNVAKFLEDAKKWGEEDPGAEESINPLGEQAKNNPEIKIKYTSDSKTNFVTTEDFEKAMSGSLFEHYKKCKEWSTSEDIQC